MNKKISFTTKSFFYLFVYVLFIWTLEAVDLFAFIVNIEQKTMVSRAVALAFIVLLVWKNRHFFSFEQKKIDYKCIIGITIIVVFSFIKCVVPDGGFDTGNYHLIAQEPGFVNYFKDYFALGNFQIWGFRLSDRLFYIPRLLLGYRMGTLFNSFVLCVSYVQMVHIVSKICNKNNKSGDIVILFSLIILLSQKTLFNFGTYGVDVLGFPFGLEAINNIINVKENKANQTQVIIFALINGFWFALKMTNIIFVAPMVLLYIFYQKDIKLKSWLLSILCCTAPCSIYIIFNYICTKNPIFPYYNTVFKSDLYLASNFADKRWGGQTLTQKLLWIFYAIFNPSERQSEISNTIGTFLYIVGIFSILFIFILTICKNDRFLFHHEIGILFLVSGILWGLTTGYERYFMFGMLLLGISACEFLIYISKNVIGKTLSMMMIGVLILIVSYQSENVLNGIEWSWRNSDPYQNNFANNFSYLLNDRAYDGDFDLSKVDSYLITEQASMGYVFLFDKEKYIYNANYINSLPEGTVKESYEEIKEKLLISRNTYDVRFSNDFNIDEYNELVSDFGIKASKIYETETCLGHAVYIQLSTIE